jgi:DNA-binding response OmpR family regulator
MQHTKPTILIIDSDVPSLELYRRELSPDYQVVVCMEQQQAYEISKDSNLRAVVLEPAIQGGEGWDLFARIQSSHKDQPIPIILCSTLDERKRGLEGGAAAFLIKPVLPMELRDTLHRVTKLR